MHLTRVNLGSIKKFFAYLQDGVPGKLRAIHVLNVVYFFDKILSMIKPFMKAEILKCVSKINLYKEFIETELTYLITVAFTFLKHGL